MHTGEKINAKGTLYQVQTASYGEKKQKDNTFKINAVPKQGKFPYKGGKSVYICVAFHFSHIFF